MRRRLIPSVMLMLVLACSPEQTGRESNTFSTIDGGEPDTSTSESGDGDGEPGDGDGQPGDGDGDGEPGDGDGQPGDGDGQPGDGDGDGEPVVCERFLHSYEFDTDTWQSQPLDQVWSGSNAPPCDVEPLAATYLEVWDQLLVWSANGMFYRRLGSVWQPPEPLGDHWAMLTGEDLDAVNYVPPLDGSISCGLVFTALPNALLYSVFEDGGTSFDGSQPLVDEPPPGPPQSSVRRNWALELADPALLGQLNWWTSWQGYANGTVYMADADLNWMAWPEQQSPMFASAPDGIDPALLEAAWGDYGANMAYLVGP